MINSLRNISLAMLLFTAGSIINPLYPEETGKTGTDLCSNFLIIKGESNISRFSFSYAARPGDQDLELNNRVWRHSAEIKIPVRKFEASNPHMYNDFLMQLHEREYPYISIRFPDFDPHNPTDLIAESNYKVFITLAGVTKQYDVECDLVKCGGHYTLSGSETVKLTDFNISPPEKLKGLIKAKDEINVDFGIIVNFTQDKSYADLR